MKLFVIFTLLLTSQIVLADPKASHGMALFGGKTVYASHLPMFHKPHDYQVILELKLANIPKTVDVLKSYEKAKVDGYTLFTINPEPLDLTDVISGKVLKFQADLYSGHFEERNGIYLGKVKIKVVRVVFSKKLDPTESEAKIEHILFGSNSEYFAAHIIKGKPSYDIIYRTSQPQNVAIVCEFRVCKTQTTPILDSALPLVTSILPFPGGIPNEAAKIGDTLGSLNKSATVLNVIYSDFGELAL